ncbi:MAG: DUF2282 domain-containing protein [Gammaproteobacteria bacterium]|nr:DUF2282 domain-containing protein [Gammaproteobacteria bacterium]
MKTTSILMSTAIGTLLAFSAVTAQGGAHEGAGAATEKCYGVAKAGENSCAANGHSCQGQAKTDKDPNEWKKVAQGECAKMGGSTTAPKPAA